MNTTNHLILKHMTLVEYELNSVHGIRADQREDLRAEGYLALVKAAHSFDSGRGVQFKSYACAAIRHAMWRLVRKDYNQNTISLHNESDDGSFLIEQIADQTAPSPDDTVCLRETKEALLRIREKYVKKKSIVAGLDALLLKQEGFNSREIGELWGKSAQYVTATVSRTRKLLADDLRNLRAAA